jgi:hypothetical protein
MPGKNITSVPWDSLLGKWVVVDSLDRLYMDGMVGRINGFIGGSIFHELRCNPYLVLNDGRAAIYDKDRIMVMKNKGWKYTIYDSLEDMQDDFMFSFLQAGARFPAIMLIGELPEFRKMVGIEAGVFKSGSDRLFRIEAKFGGDK